MSDSDTVKLLRECNSGIQMAVFSIDEILEKVTDKNLYEILKKSKEKHEKLGDETHAILAECGDETKEPNMLAKGMSWMKTNAKVMMDDSDATIADLIVDGCNMGIKTLCRYENQYAAADEKSKKLTDDLIRLEEKLRQDQIIGQLFGSEGISIIFSRHENINSKQQDISFQNLFL